ncbi:MAG: pyridoxal phosphate-dependent aminotransferase [Deltaproteobacteria bacterium]|nr:pyridoxal phosphate-dependent aminotransferase [Deltaproteobacteria bacterium]
MPVAQKLTAMIEGQSWIRKMFTEGARLKAEYGPENVFDFSLGNPDPPPPAQFYQVLQEVAADEKLSHGYMPNSGWPQVCQSVADYLTKEQGLALGAKNIIMTVGAAGGLNVILKALLDPGDEVVTPTPYFVEYAAYAENHAGRLVTAPSLPDFHLDLKAMEAALGERSRAVLINSPHNPTGVVYSAEELAQLAQVLERASQRFNRRIYLIADEPYRKIIYDDLKAPSVWQAYPHSMIVASYSKDLSLAGERIGFLAVSPGAEDAEMIVAASTLANRILGYVNAPSLMQLVVGQLQGVSVDVSIYQRRRDLLCEGLTRLGYEHTLPQGAFYLFPKSPLPDDVEFTRRLAEERILVVPGVGFGAPGYFRISYCVAEETIRRSMEGFARVIEKI